MAILSHRALKEAGWSEFSGGGWYHHVYGGSSGGGSINLFYQASCEVEISSQTNVTSPASLSGGVGGNGTVNITKIE